MLATKTNQHQTCTLRPDANLDGAPHHLAITIGWKHYATTNFKIEIYVWYKCCEFFSFSYLVTLCLVGQATAINVLLNTARNHIWVAVGFFVEKSLTGGLHY
jgi:hypothetical protein